MRVITLLPLSIMQNSKKTGSYREKCIFPLSEKSISKSKTRVVWTAGRFTCFGWFFCIMFFLMASSCSPAKKSIYFENLQKDTTLRNVVTPNYELKIQKNDILGITVAGLSPDIAFYNASSGASASGGYPLDVNGNISFVKLGSIHAEGMTRRQLKDTLEKSLVPYLKDVVVTVSFQNRHVTMMGAVGARVLPLADDNMTILDAIAASGDIGEKGRIDNILVIRDTGSAKIFKRLNLENNSIFSSPYYYLQPNDIVYVEPVKIKTKVTVAQVISYITTGLSLIFLILNTLKL